MCPKDRIEGLTSDMLHAFRSAHYTGKRAVLAAAGVEHEHLLECANKYLADMPAGDGDVFRPDIARYGQPCGGWLCPPYCSPAALTASRDRHPTQLHWWRCAHCASRAANGPQPPHTRRHCLPNAWLEQRWCVHYVCVCVRARASALLMRRVRTVADK